MDKTHLNRVGTGHENNRDGFGCPLCCCCRRSVEAGKQGHIPPEKFGRKRRQEIVVTVCPDCAVFGKSRATIPCTVITRTWSASAHCRAFSDSWSVRVPDRN
jgi:hypothetical protein